MAVNVTREEIMAQKYCSILDRTKAMTFSWSVAEQLVGGKARLIRLMQENKIAYDKPLNAANTRWQFSANDVLRNIKPMRDWRLKILNDSIKP